MTKSRSATEAQKVSAHQTELSERCKQNVKHPFSLYNYMDFLLQLQKEGITRHKFMQMTIDAFINQDENFMSFLYKEKDRLKIGKKFVRTASKKQKKQKEQFERDFNDKEVDDIFDLVAREFPEL